jgi:hypothetical protein
MSVITQAQVLELEQNQTFRDMAKQFVRDRAIYVAGQDGTSGSTAGLSPVEWAKQRYISKSIILHPNNQDYQSWASQFSMFLKGQDVWDTDAATTIQAMVTSQKFEELANLTFELRAAQIEF